MLHGDKTALHGYNDKCNLHQERQMATKAIDKQTGEITLSNPFSLATSEDNLILPSPSYSIRNNCQLGQWTKSDGVTIIGNKLDLSILHVERLFGDLGKTRNAHWLQVWGISPQVGNEKIVFVTYVKSLSLTILGNAILDCALEGKNPADLIFRTSFTPRSNEYGSYFSLAFETVDRAADDPKREAINRFLGSNPTFLDTNVPNSLFLVGSMDQAELDDELAKRRTDRKN